METSEQTLLTTSYFKGMKKSLEKAKNIKASKGFKIAKAIWLTLCTIVTIWIIAYVVSLLLPSTYGPYGKVVERVSSFGNNTSLWNIDTKEKIVDNLEWIRWNGDSIAVISSAGKRGYVNVNNGKMIVRPSFDKAWQFHDGLAAIQINGRIGFINTAGEFAFDKLFLVPDENVTDKEFKHGYCIMPIEDGRVGIIDKHGNWILKPQYDFIQRDGNGGWFRAYKDGISLLYNPQIKTEIESSNLTLESDTILIRQDSTIYRYVRILQ